MAPVASLFSLYLIILFISYLSNNCVECVRTKKKIYLDLVTQNACFRVLNATHQVGCSSKSGGNVGVLHYLEGQDDYDWVLKDGPHTPYVVLMNSEDFHREKVQQLLKSGRVNGILLVNVLNNSTLTPLPPNGFSADKDCPNDNYGAYYKNDSYKHCKSVKWNKPGEALYFTDYHDFPMFAISNISDLNILIDQCYRPFNQPSNGVAKTYPICAVELSDSMDAAKDSITCIRRSELITNLNPTKYCDAMGDKNLISTMKAIPQNETRPAKSVIVVATRMDSFSMFGYEYQNSDTTVTGIVALLAAAHALKQVKDDLRAASSDLMFTFFQGEAFDYIGSSRMVYDMELNHFPYDITDNKSLRIQNIHLNHISHFIELSQLGHRDQGQLWIHSDPISKENPAISDEVKKLIDIIKPIGEKLNVSLGETAADQPLPPASVQRFLRKMAIPSIVITDHEKQYTNKYYNSRFDLPREINADYPDTLNDTEKYDYITEQAVLLTNIATTLARFLYTQTTGKQLTPDLENKIQADEKEIAHLLYCFLESPVCELFKQSVSPEDKDNLASAKKPFPFYVGVDYQTNQITRLAHAILAQYLGDRMVNVTKDTDCKQPDNDKRYKYLWMQGSVKPGTNTREGWCIKSTAMLQKAKSPAFEIDDYDWLSGEYSTWTESTWTVTKVRAFLIPSESQEVLTLCVGLALFIVSLGVVYFFNASSDIIFLSTNTASDTPPS
ncbi:nicastrin isoform X1 [Patella vulgata]|uniref:nicastrin isoform X1 n=1 Tax=Patella vulgata TaxID=6465 RepID=UPI0024A85799|nr:nicastrin isoform X1 [Patella vulgata]